MFNQEIEFFCYLSSRVTVGFEVHRYDWKSQHIKRHNNAM